MAEPLAMIYRSVPHIVCHIYGFILTRLLTASETSRAQSHGPDTTCCLSIKLALFRCAIHFPVATIANDSVSLWSVVFIHRLDSRLACAELDIERVCGKLDLPHG